MRTGVQDDAYEEWNAGEVESVTEELQAFEVVGSCRGGGFDLDADHASVGCLHDQVDLASLPFTEVEEACFGVAPAELSCELPGYERFQQWSGCWLGGA